MVSDVDLLEAWRAGDRGAANELIDRHFESLFRFFRTKVGDEADELIQRTLVALLGARDRFRGASSFRTFLFGIARLELRAWMRSRCPAATDPEVEELSASQVVPSPSNVAAVREEHRVLLGALRRLPLDMQVALELHYWEALSASEIAEVIAVPVGTVKSRLRRARELLETHIRRLAARPELVSSTLGNLEAWASALGRVVATRTTV